MPDDGEGRLVCGWHGTKSKSDGLFAQVLSAGLLLSDSWNLNPLSFAVVVIGRLGVNICCPRHGGRATVFEGFLL